jgi:hypothetical protein
LQNTGKCGRYGHLSSCQNQQQELKRQSDERKPGSNFMKRLLTIFVLLWGTAAAQAVQTSTAALKDQLDALKELQQSKLESQKELQVKDIEAVRQQITAVDKRVDDQLTQLGQSVDRLGILITILGVGITVLLVLGGFLGYRNAKSEAKEAASDAAKASAQEWFDKQAMVLKEKIEAMENKAALLHAEMDQHAQGVQEHAADIAKALITAQESIGKTSTQAPSGLEESTKVLAQRDRELRASTEDSYSFDDWNTRAHAAYTNGALEDAGYFWLRAARVTNAGAANVAQVLINRAITQGDLNQREAAIATYDEVIRRFGEAPELALREHVARALLNKGSLQSKLNDNEAAIVTNDELLKRCVEATEPRLLKKVAMALVNKGVAQCRQNQLQAAMITFDEVLHRFGEAVEPHLRDAVAKSLVNKGIAQEQLNQYEAAIATYDETLRRFGEDTDLGIQIQVARALVNKGIAQDRGNQGGNHIATFDEVVRRFAEAAEPTIRQQVALALNGRGFHHLIQAKSLMQQEDPEAKLQLQIALENLNDAAHRCARPNGLILGNRAYVQYLLGNVDAASDDFAEALRAPEDGGKGLYEATLKDLDINPLTVDIEIRKMVEKAWATFQMLRGSGSGL